MQNLVRIGLVTLTMSLMARTTVAQDAVQWRVEDGGNGHWYAHVEADLNWHDAEAAAIAAGGHLATITSSEENELLKSLSPGAAHLGGRASGPGNVLNNWYWITGEDWDFSDWCCTNPNYPGEKALAFDGGLNGWNNIHYPGEGKPVPTHGYMIEWSADCNGDGIVDYGQILEGTLSDEDGNGVPDCCDQGEQCIAPVQWRVEDGGNGHWYLIENSQPLSWNDASNQAEAIGGVLVCLESAEEQSWVFDFAEQQSFWLGLYQDPDTGEPNEDWQWLSGAPLSYENWDTGEPNESAGAVEDRAQVLETIGTWNDLIGDVTQAQSAEIATIIEWSADCNGDGIVDYGQILDGTFSDDDGNGVPDCCDDTTCLAPVQWRAEDGGNGHWYRPVINDGDISWIDANERAGVNGGHLASLNSAEENAFVHQLAQRYPDAWSSNGPWLGGYEVDNGDEGTNPWAWTSGEAFLFTAWKKDNPDGDGDNLAFWDINDPAEESWNDAPEDNDMVSYIIEWSADCNNDGIVDYGQILDGTLLDDDGDGIPNPCDQPGGIDGIFDVPSEYDTIQEAIDDAPEGGLILVAEGTFQPASELNTQGRALTIRGAVDGEGAPVTTLDGQETIRLATCVNGEGADTVFENLILINGYSSDGGGAFFFDGTSPTVNNCVFQNCRAAGGGAVECRNSCSSIFSSCLFINNDGTNGGGAIYCYDNCHLTFNDCLFRDNTTVFEGAGIYASFESSADINDTVFENNAAGGRGGAVFLSEEGMITRCDFITNNADTGGAIQCQGGAPSITECTFTGNIAPNDGGALFFNEQTTPIILDCTFTANQTDHEGAGVYCAPQSVADIRNCTFDSNDAHNGGGVFFSEDGSVQDTAFIGNIARFCGGGLSAVGNGQVELSGCMFTTNESQSSIEVQGGGALYLQDCESVLVQDCQFEENSAQNIGGAVMSLNASCTFNDCEFRFNVAQENAGGAVYIKDSFNVVMNTCVLEDNTARFGGAVNCDGGNTSFNGSTFTNNVAKQEGGGLYVVNGASIELVFCLVSGNSAVDLDSEPPENGMGGGVRNINSDAATVQFDSTYVCGNFPDQISGPSTDNGGGGSANLCEGLYGDCNSDGIPDFFQIFEGTFADCDGNGVPDDCDLTDAFSASEPRTPINTDDVIAFDVSAMADASEPVTVTISALGDYEAPGSLMILKLVSGKLTFIEEVLFGFDGENCTMMSTTLQIPEADWNQAGLNDDRMIEISGTTIQSTLCEPDRFTAITVEVPIAFQDCNDNGLWDACEVSDGSVLDSDGDGVIDDCDGCPNDPEKTAEGLCDCGTPDTDSDADGTPDCIDLCPDWPHACSEDGQTLFVSLDQSIQGAIDAVPAGGVIILNEGTYLPESTLDTNGQALTIRGAVDADGNPTSIIDGQNAMRLLVCENGETSKTVFENLVVQNGEAENGAGLYCMASAPTVTNCLFTNNSATNQGGGIFNENSSPVLIDCAFSGNTAFWGGGICNTASEVSLSNCTLTSNIGYTGAGMRNGSSTISIDGCVFESNQTDNSGNDSGGGIYNEYSILNLSDCTFVNNNSNYGGGMYSHYGSQATLANCSFDANTGYTKAGGMLLVGGSDANCTNCSFTTNTSGDGGGIHVDGSNATLNECQFTSNTATNGGGIRLIGNSTSSLNDCTFEENTASVDGGGIQVHSSAPTISDCVFTQNTAGSGGGGLSHFPQGSSTVVRCIFTNNTANTGGGAANSDSSFPNYDQCEFTGNVAESSGVHPDPPTAGAMYSNSMSVPSITNSIFCSNIQVGTTQVYGSDDALAGNCISETCDSDLDGTLDCVDGCPDDPDKTEPGVCDCGTADTDTDADGLADCVDPCPEWPNVCSEDGQTLFVAVGESIQNAINLVPAGGTVEIAAGSFQPGAPLDTQGRPMTIIGAPLDADGLPTTILDGQQTHRVLQCVSGEGPETVFENLWLTGGSAVAQTAPEYRGGGMYNEGSSPTLRFCWFVNNASSNDGGGMANYLSSSPTLETCVFIDNTARFGGALANSNESSPLLSDCTVENNEAIISGGGLYSEVASTPELIDSVVCGNLADQIAGGYDDLGGNCILEDCGTDLDENGVPDTCDPDCNNDGTPDGLETDCDGDGIPDDCAITDGLVEDCNANGIPDTCDITDGTDADVNANDVPDDCEYRTGDLNLDGCIDGSDLATLLALWGFSNPPVGDLNGDGTIDGQDLATFLANWEPCP